MACCSVWPLLLLLLLLCVSSAAGVPIASPQGAADHAGNETILLRPEAQPPNITVRAAAPTLNVTHDATSGNGTVSITLGLLSNSSETLEELDDDLIVQEGDILMSEDRNAVRSLWLNAIVPYVLSYELAHRESELLAAFSMISSVSCIRFKERTMEPNYLNIKGRRGCASFVGCQGGAQALYYGRSCSVGNLCHELVHALGLYHEHTREDRDQHITVQWQSIIPRRKKNFKVKHGDTLNLPYDINSIMHYGWYFFSRDGGATLLPKQGGEHMGQRKHLSPLDIQKLNALYHCDERLKAQWEG